MGSCYSGNHIAEDIHTDIPTCSIEEPRQKYRLGTVKNSLLGRRGGGSLTHQRTNKGNKQITNKADDETVMRMRQKQSIVTPGNP